MKHAGADALDVLEPLVAKIRLHAQLKEKKRGIFCRKGKSFLHFHEDRAGLFADVSEGSDSWRLRVSAPAEQKRCCCKSSKNYSVIHEQFTNIARSERPGDAGRQQLDAYDPRRTPPAARAPQ